MKFREHDFTENVVYLTLLPISLSIFHFSTAFDTHDTIDIISRPTHILMHFSTALTSHLEQYPNTHLSFHTYESIDIISHSTVHVFHLWVN